VDETLRIIKKENMFVIIVKLRIYVCIYTSYISISRKFVKKFNFFFNKRLISHFGPREN